MKFSRGICWLGQLWVLINFFDDVNSAFHTGPLAHIKGGAASVAAKEDEKTLGRIHEKLDTSTYAASTTHALKDSSSQHVSVKPQVSGDQVNLDHAPILTGEANHRTEHRPPAFRVCNIEPLDPESVIQAPRKVLMPVAHPPPISITQRYCIMYWQPGLLVSRIASALRTGSAHANHPNEELSEGQETAAAVSNPRHAVLKRPAATSSNLKDQKEAALSPSKSTAHTNDLDLHSYSETEASYEDLWPKLSDQNRNRNPGTKVQMNTVQTSEPENNRLIRKVDRDSGSSIHHEVKYMVAKQQPTFSRNSVSEMHKNPTTTQATIRSGEDQSTKTATQSITSDLAYHLADGTHQIGGSKTQGATRLSHLDRSAGLVLDPASLPAGNPKCTSDKVVPGNPAKPLMPAAPLQSGNRRHKDSEELRAGNHKVKQLITAAESTELHDPIAATQPAKSSYQSNDSSLVRNSEKAESTTAGNSRPQNPRTISGKADRETEKNVSDMTAVDHFPPLSMAYAKSGPLGKYEGKLQKSFRKQPQKAETTSGNGKVSKPSPKDNLHYQASPEIANEKHDILRLDLSDDSEYPLLSSIRPLQQHHQKSKGNVKKATIKTGSDSPGPSNVDRKNKPVSAMAQQHELKLELSDRSRQPQLVGPREQRHPPSATKDEEKETHSSNLVSAYNNIPREEAISVVGQSHGKKTSGSFNSKSHEDTLKREVELTNQQKGFDEGLNSGELEEDSRPSDSHRSEGAASLSPERPQPETAEDISIKNQEPSVDQSRGPTQAMKQRKKSRAQLRKSMGKHPPSLSVKKPANGIAGSPDTSTTGKTSSFQKIELKDIRKELAADKVKDADPGKVHQKVEELNSQGRDIPKTDFFPENLEKADKDLHQTGIYHRVRMTPVREPEMGFSTVSRSAREVTTAEKVPDTQKINKDTHTSKDAIRMDESTQVIAKSKEAYLSQSAIISLPPEDLKVSTPLLESKIHAVTQARQDGVVTDGSSSKAKIDEAENLPKTLGLKLEITLQEAFGIVGGTRSEEAVQAQSSRISEQENQIGHLSISHGEQKIHQWKTEGFDMALMNLLVPFFQLQNPKAHQGLSGAINELQYHWLKNLWQKDHSQLIRAEAWINSQMESYEGARRVFIFRHQIRRHTMAAKWKKEREEWSANGAGAPFEITIFESLYKISVKQNLLTEIPATRPKYPWKLEKLFFNFQKEFSARLKSILGERVAQRRLITLAYLEERSNPYIWWNPTQLEAQYKLNGLDILTVLKVGDSLQFGSSFMLKHGIGRMSADSACLQLMKIMTDPTRHVPWIESAERHWLVKNYEYVERLQTLIELITQTDLINKERLHTIEFVRNQIGVEVSPSDRKILGEILKWCDASIDTKFIPQSTRKCHHHGSFLSSRLVGLSENQRAAIEAMSDWKKQQSRKVTSKFKTNYELLLEWKDWLLTGFWAISQGKLKRRC